MLTILRFTHFQEKKSEVGWAFKVAPTVRNGASEVEGQTEEFETWTLERKSVKGKWLVKRTVKWERVGTQWEAEGFPQVPLNTI